LELSKKVFNKPNYQYIGRLERGIAIGITFATADKIMLTLDSELEFDLIKKDVPDFCKSFIFFVT